MNSKTLKTLEHANDPLIDVLKSENISECEEILEVFEIIGENDMKGLNSNIEKQSEWEEFKVEPDEDTCACVKTEEDPLIDVLKSENLSEDGEFLEVFDINDEDVVEDGNSNDREQPGREELETEPHEAKCACTNIEADPLADIPNSEDVFVGEETCVDIRPTSSEPVDSGQDVELKLNPPKKIKLTAEEPHSSCVDDFESKHFLSGVNNNLKAHVPYFKRFPFEKYWLSQLIEQLIEFHPMSAHEAETVTKKILYKLLEWVSTVRPGTLHMYQVRLKVAELAFSLGVHGFTPQDEWFINFKNQLPKRFVVEYQPVNHDGNLSCSGFDSEDSDTVSDNDVRKSRNELFKQLAIWYHEESTKLMLSPGQLERKYYSLVVSEEIGSKTCYLSKDGMWQFVKQQGLYCNINGKVSRLMKVQDDFLGLLFEAIFEVWYHQWPISTDVLLQNLREHCSVFSEIPCLFIMFKSYLATLFEWLVQEYRLSSNLSTPAVDSAKIEFAMAVFGPEHFLICKKFSQALIAELETEIFNIRSFSRRFGQRHCYKSYTLCSEHLKKNADELALNMGLSGILITKNWLQRFAELTVACSLTPVMYHDHPRDSNNYFPVGEEHFHAAFHNWYLYGSSKNVNNCEAGDIMKRNKLQRQILTLSTPEFLEEVNNWYDEQRTEGVFVKSYELKEKSEEIAHHMGMSDFKATKWWMRRFLMCNGIRYYNELDGTVMFSQRRSPYDHKFKELFEAWYREGSCTKCARRVLLEDDDKEVSDEESCENSQLSEFEAIIRKWYIEVSSSLSVMPGDLERKVVECAKQLDIKDLIPSKSLIERYIGQYGLCCNINGNRELFFKSEFAFLKCKFLSEFEVWYHQWPLTLENTVLKDDCRSNLDFELYEKALLKWYVKMSEIGKISVDDIKSKSAFIIETKFTGITTQDVEVWTKRWCRQHNDAVRRMRSFDYGMRMWYFLENKKARYITPDELRMKAEQFANTKIGFPNFKATDAWLMRFVERYGVYCVTKGVPKFLSSVYVLDVGGFQELYNAWCDCKPTGKELKGISTSGSQVDPESSSDPRPAESAEVMEDPLQERMTFAFEAEVTAWFQVASKSYTVSPGQYLEKVIEIRKDSGLPVYQGLIRGFVHRKNCIKKLVGLHGIQLGFSLNENSKYIDAKFGILKSRFELAFEIWYYAYPLQLEDVKVDDIPLDNDDLNLIKLFVSALHDWYVVLRKNREVSPGEIMLTVTEIVNSLTSSRSKRDLIARWCHEFGSQSVTWIKRISEFDSQVGSWYSARKHSVKPKDLIKQAEQTARKMGIEGFFATVTWLRRFVQLHGLHFMYKGVEKDFLGYAECSTKHPQFGFSRYFAQWLKTDYDNVKRLVYFSKTTVDESDEKLNFRFAFIPETSSGNQNPRPTKRLVIFNKPTCDESNEQSKVGSVCVPETLSVKQNSRPTKGLMCVSKSTDGDSNGRANFGSASVPEALSKNGNLRLTKGLVCVNKPYNESNELSKVGSASAPETLPGNRNSRPAKDVLVMNDDTARVNMISAFEAEVAAWFHVAAKRRRVCPAQYLEKVMEIRKDSGLTVYIGLTKGFEDRKNCIKKLVGFHGIQLGQGKKCRFINADCSILRWRFELAFEIWYHAYPLHLDHVDCSLGITDFMHHYLSAIHDWYEDRHKTGEVSAEEIKLTETDIADRFTLSKEKRALVADWCREWCFKSAAWIRKISSLDSYVGSWYRARKCCVTPRQLKAQAEKTSWNLDIEGFSASKAWLKRFVQLHGLCFTYKGVLKDLSGYGVGSVNPDWSSFSAYFREWLETDDSNKTGLMRVFKATDNEKSNDSVVISQPMMKDK